MTNFFDPRPGMDQHVTRELQVADERIAPSRGRVRCCICGHWIPLESAFWYEMEDRGLLLVRIAGHSECFSEKTGHQIRAIAHRTIYDIYLGDREAFGGVCAGL